jgi:hypothetical protein
MSSTGSAVPSCSSSSSSRASCSGEIHSEREATRSRPCFASSSSSSVFLRSTAASAARKYSNASSVRPSANSAWAASRICSTGAGSVPASGRGIDVARRVVTAVLRFTIGCPPTMTTHLSCREKQRNTGKWHALRQDRGAVTSRGGIGHD